MGKTLLCTIGLAFAGSALLCGQWKVRPAGQAKAGAHSAAAQPSGAGHFLIPEDREDSVAALGGSILARIPGHGAIARLPNGIAAAEPIDASSKISPELAKAAGIGYFLVEFFPDSDPAERELLAIRTGFVIRRNPDVGPAQLLIYGSSSRLTTLASHDNVAYIFPASNELVRGEPVVACLNAVASIAGTGQYITAVGEGWDGPGRNNAALTYSFGSLTSRIAPEVIRGIVARATAEWSKAVQVTFTPGQVEFAQRNIHILFASGSHGDQYPFDGPGKVLAHTFYPAPPSPEPVAGDMHLDADESWHDGADIDLFSIVLHELGHALGLGHADSPVAVMYPYYRRVSTLSTTDVASIQMLYAAAGNVGVTPLQIRLLSTTVASAMGSFRGTASGPSGIAQIRWTNSRGGSGIAAGSSDWQASVPLLQGDNTVRFTAVALDGSEAAMTSTVTWSPPAVADRVPPAISIYSPASSSSSTSASSVVIAGYAYDNVGVTEIRWSTSTGKSGLAAGTASWRVDSLPLLVGTNAITVRAYDAAGNSSWRSIVITRR